MGSRPHLRARRCPARRPALTGDRAPPAPAAVSIAETVYTDSLAGPILAIGTSPPATQSALPRRRTRVALSKPKLARILSAVRDTARWRRGIDAATDHPATLHAHPPRRT